jgi:hypothetical protein
MLLVEATKVTVFIMIRTLSFILLTTIAFASYSPHSSQHSVFKQTAQILPFLQACVMREFVLRLTCL